MALDSGTPCRNDAVGAGRFYNLEFIHYPGVNFLGVMRWEDP